MKEKYREQWEKLGSDDPYWAVLTDPNKKGGKWSAEEFFKTGKEEIEDILSRLSKLGINPGRGVALDFGCGVGRLSRALAREFQKVIALDISSSMLKEARKVNYGIENIEFTHNTSEYLKTIPESSIDFLYSNIVLQHTPKNMQITYLKEFSRVLKPDGILAVQTPSSLNLRYLKAWAYLMIGNNILNAVRRVRYGPAGVMELHALPKAMVLETLQQSGMEVVHYERYDSAGPTFVSYMYFAKKNQQDGHFGQKNRTPSSSP